MLRNASAAKGVRQHVLALVPVAGGCRGKRGEERLSQRACGERRGNWQITAKTTRHLSRQRWELRVSVHAPERVRLSTSKLTHEPHADDTAAVKDCCEKMEAALRLTHVDIQRRHRFHTVINEEFWSNLRQAPLL